MFSEFAPQPCDVCGADMPVIGYREGNCPRCDSWYSYDESVSLVLDAGQLWAVKVFTLAREQWRRFKSLFRSSRKLTVTIDGRTRSATVVNDTTIQMDRPIHSFDQSQFEKPE